MRKQKVMVVDGVTPHAADAPGHGESATREAAEDVEELRCRWSRPSSGRPARCGADQLGEGLRSTKTGTGIYRRRSIEWFYTEETEIDPVSRFRAGVV
jgi:hypothetical protein